MPTNLREQLAMQGIPAGWIVTRNWQVLRLGWAWEYGRLYGTGIVDALYGLTSETYPPINEVWLTIDSQLSWSTDVALFEHEDNARQAARFRTARSRSLPSGRQMDEAVTTNPEWCQCCLGVGQVDEYTFSFADGHVKTGRTKPCPGCNGVGLSKRAIEWRREHGSTNTDAPAFRSLDKAE